MATCALCNSPATIPRLRRSAILSCSELVAFASTRIATARPYGQADTGNCARAFKTSSGFTICSSFAATSLSSPTACGRTTRYGLLQCLLACNTGNFAGSAGATACNWETASGKAFASCREHPVSNRHTPETPTQIFRHRPRTSAEKLTAPPSEHPSSPPKSRQPPIQLPSSREAGSTAGSP
jgi:hypothetical protein